MLLCAEIVAAAAVYAFDKSISAVAVALTPHAVKRDKSKIKGSSFN